MDDVGEHRVACLDRSGLNRHLVLIWRDDGFDEDCYFLVATEVSGAHQQ